MSYPKSDTIKWEPVHAEKEHTPCLVDPAPFNIGAMRSSSHLRYLTWFQKNLRPRQNLRSCLFYLIPPTLQSPPSPPRIHLQCEAILMWQKHQEPTLKWPNTHHSIIYFTKEGLSLATPRQLTDSALAVSGPMLHALPAHALIILTASLKGTYYLQSSLLSSVRRLGSENLKVTDGQSHLNAKVVLWQELQSQALWQIKERWWNGGYPKATKFGEGLQEHFRTDATPGPGPLGMDLRQRWAASAVGLDVWYSLCIYFSENNCTDCGVLWLLSEVIETQPKGGETKEGCPWNVHKARKGSWASGSNESRPWQQTRTASLPSACSLPFFRPASLALPLSHPAAVRAAGRLAGF